MSQNCNRINNFFRRNVFCILILIEGGKGNRNLKKNNAGNLHKWDRLCIPWEMTAHQFGKYQKHMSTGKQDYVQMQKYNTWQTSLTTRWNGWKSTNLQNWKTGLQHYVQRCVSVSVLVVVCQKEQFTWSRTVNLWMKASARTKTLVWSWTQTLENTW